GVLYYIAGGEALVAGQPLTEETPEAVPPSRPVLSMGNTYSLRSEQTQGTRENSGSVQSYTPAIGTFTSGSIRYSAPVDLGGRARDLGQYLAQMLSDVFGDSTQYTGVTV